MGGGGTVSGGGTVGGGVGGGGTVGEGVDGGGTVGGGGAVVRDTSVVSDGLKWTREQEQYSCGTDNPRSTAGGSGLLRCRQMDRGNMLVSNPPDG